MTRASKSGMIAPRGAVIRDEFGAKGASEVSPDAGNLVGLPHAASLAQAGRHMSDGTGRMRRSDRDDGSQPGGTKAGSELGLSHDPASVSCDIGFGEAIAEDSAELSDLSANISALAEVDRRQKLRIIEALLFASREPLDQRVLQDALMEGDDVAGLIAELQQSYSGRGVNLVQVAGKWCFRTAEDLAYLMERHSQAERKLSRAALETLSIIAYHQPVTRAEIEEIRGVGTSKGTLDVLLETDWVRLRGRRRAPGRPVTYGTTAAFLEHFSLASLSDLPGLAELRGAGLLEGTLPPGFTIPDPRDLPSLAVDEDPLDGDEHDDLLADDEMSIEDDSLNFEASDELGAAPEAPTGGGDASNGNEF